MPNHKAPLSDTCAHCGVAFHARPQSVRAGMGRFCSLKCHRASKGTFEARFWSKVNKNGPVPAHRPELGPCWPWTGATDSQGYGRLGAPEGRKTISAHRAAWELLHGPIPEGMELCHHCDNRPCVNAETHHFLGTVQDNSRDMMAKGRGGGQIGSGEHSPFAKLDWAGVREIRRRYAAGGTSHRKLAAELSLTASTVSGILAGRTWKE